MITRRHALITAGSASLAAVAVAAQPDEGDYLNDLICNIPPNETPDLRRYYTMVYSTSDGLTYVNDEERWVSVGVRS